MHVLNVFVNDFYSVPPSVYRRITPFLKTFWTSGNEVYALKVEATSLLNGNMLHVCSESIGRE